MALAWFLLMGALGWQRDPGARIVVDVQRMDILLTVTDKRGRFITDLSKDQFEVTEDGQPQKILGFATRGELPLRLAIVIDASGSVRDRFRFVQEAAIAFIESAMRPRVDKALVLTFDHSVQQAVDFSGDPAELATVIRGLRPGGGTALFDAIHLASKEKLAAEQPRERYRRAIVLVSDGDDNESRWTREQALEMAQKADVVIYAVSTNSDRIETRGDKILKYMTEQTGGLAYFPLKSDDLTRSFRQLADELRHQYNIYYRPEGARADGRYHSVTVSVKGRRNLVVRSRKGYYAPLAGR